MGANPAAKEPFFDENAIAFARLMFVSSIRLQEALANNQLDLSIFIYLFFIYLLFKRDSRRKDSSTN